MKEKVFIILFTLLIINTSSLIYAENIADLEKQVKEYLDKNDFSATINILKKISELDPVNPDHLNDLASVYAKTNKLALAKETYLKAIELSPGFVKAYNNLGLVYIAQKEFMEGIAILEKALEQNPDYDKTYLNLALAYYNLQMTYKAIELIEKGVNRFPDNNELIFKLATLYEEMEWKYLALKNYRLVLKNEPNNIKALSNLSAFYIKNQLYKKAIETLHKIISNSASYAKEQRIYYYIGFCYLKQKDYQNSIKYIKTNLEFYPKEFESHYLLYSIYLILNDFLNAHTQYNKLIKLQPDYKFLTSQLPLLEQILEYSIFLKSDPDNDELKIILANLYYKIGLMNKVLDITNSLNNNNIYPAMFLKGLVYYRRGNLTKAKNIFENIIKNFPDKTESHFWLRNIYRDLDEYFKAVNEHNKILSLSKDYIFPKPPLLEIDRYDSSFFNLKQTIGEYHIYSILNPSDPDNYYKLSRFYAEQNNIIKSNEYFLKLKNKFDNSDQTVFNKYPLLKKIREKDIGYFNSAKIFKKDIDKERDILRAEIKKDNKNYKLHYAYGNLFKEKGLYDYTILEYLDVILYNRNFIPVYPDLADMYLKTGNYSEALITAKKLITIAPDNSLSYFLLGKIYYYLHDFRLSEINFKKAIALDSHNHSSYNWLRAIYIINNDKEAVFKLQQEITTKGLTIENFNNNELTNEQKLIKYNVFISTENQNNILYYLRLTDLLIDIGELDYALDIIQKALTVSPYDLSLKISKGKILYNKGDLTEALKILKEVFKNDKNNPDVHFYLRNIYRDNGEIKKAIAEHNDILKLNPNYNFPVFKIISYKKMINEFKIQLTLHPDNADIYYQLAYTNYAKGLILQAEKNINKCLLIDQTHQKGQVFSKHIQEIKKQLPKSRGDILFGAKHILVKDLDEARKVVELLNAGEEFETIARIKSLDKNTADNGGDLGFFHSGEFLEEFEQAVKKLEPGEISNIIKSSLGYHIIKRTK